MQPGLRQCGLLLNFAVYSPSRRGDCGAAADGLRPRTAFGLPRHRGSGADSHLDDHRLAPEACAGGPCYSCVTTSTRTTNSTVPRTTAFRSHASAWTGASSRRTLSVSLPSSHSRTVRSAPPEATCRVRTERHHVHPPVVAGEGNGLALSRFSVIYVTPPCVIIPRSPVQGSRAVREHLCLTRPYVSKARTLAGEGGRSFSHRAHP